MSVIKLSTKPQYTPVPLIMQDMVFWATTFWQEQVPPQNRSDQPSYFLPDEAANEIAEQVCALGFENVTAESVHMVYQSRT